MNDFKKFLLKWLINISVPFFMCYAYLFIAGTIFSAFDLKMAEIALYSPFLEEGVRFISLFIGGYVKYLFTLFFAIGEFIDHINYYNREVGFVPVSFVAFRIVCIIAHFFLLAIQLFGYYYSKKYNSKLYLYMGLTAAISWHYAFNTGVGHIVNNFVTYALEKFGLF